MRQVRLGIVAVLLGSQVVAADPLEGDAFQLARNSGTVIGAATACGLASDRAGVVWKRLRAAGVARLGPARERDFAVVHAEAVRSASAQQQAAGRRGCDRALAAFRELEDQTTVTR